MSSFKDRLKKMEAKANIAEIKKKASSPFWVDIANGTYTTVPVKAECGFKNDDETKLYWMLTFLVQDGSEGDGKQLTMYFNLAQEFGIENAYRAVAALGYDVNDDDFSLADSLEGICEELLAQQPDVKVRVSTSTPKDGPNAGNTYQNFNIQRSDWGEDSDVDDDDEEEKPAPKAKAAAKPAAKAEPPKPPTRGRGKAAAKPEPEDDDDEEEAPKPTTRRGRRAAAETPAEKKIKAATVDEDDDEEEPTPVAEDVDEEEDETDEEEADLEVGNQIAFEFKGETLKGKVLEFIDDDTRVRVELPDKRVVKASIEKITEVLK